MKRFVVFLLLAALLLTPVSALAAPRFTTLSVVPEKSVSLMGEGLPDNTLFDVYFGRMGTRGVNGTYVGAARTNGLGKFINTYTIPLALSKDYQIDVMLVSYEKGKPKYKYFTQFINREDATNLTLVKINPTRNITISVSGLQDESRYTVWMRATPTSTPYKAGMFETRKGKTFATVQVPIPVKLRGEPGLYVVIVDRYGYIVTSGYFYNR